MLIEALGVGESSSGGLLYLAACCKGAGGRFCLVGCFGMVAQFNTMSQ